MCACAFTLLNTRPSHQAQALNQAVREIGGDTLNCPQLAISGLAFPLNKRSDMDKWIFTSVNAVTHFFAQTDLPAQAEVFAIGRATAKALAPFVEQVQLPKVGFDSEGLLLLPALQAIQGQTVALVKGKGGRNLIEHTLVERGAICMELAVYQRLPVPFCDQSWQAFRQAELPIVLASSLESLSNLLNNLPNNLNNDRAWCLDQILIVFSQRIAQSAKEIGWQGPIWPLAEQSVTGIIQTLNQQLTDSVTNLEKDEP